MSTAALATTPHSSMTTEGNGNATGGPSSTSRQMRLKVSYTFDDASSSNCLARWPHLVSTPVVQVDSDLLVGAVELKTCILSIISASPELVATLGQDYSVYAYDFSEAGFPLVGCGMLSWAMLHTQNSPTRIMVTGRVSCNTFAFFSNDAIKETLEVKFKLQKVETFTQEQFVRSVHTYTALARSLPGDFDAPRWSNFINQNPHILASQNLEKLPAVEAPPSYPPPQPAPPPRTSQWNESANLSASEEPPQPPRKRQKTAPRRPTKPTAPRKKPSSSAASPAEFPPTTQQLPPLEVNQQSFQAPPSDCEPSVNRSLSRESSAVQTLHPLSEASPAMASSPPTQSEEGDAGPMSPAPTSPSLPALPDIRPSEPSISIRQLETLYEEPEPNQNIQPRGGLVLPGPRPRNPFSGLPSDDIAPSTDASQTAAAAKAAKKSRRRPSKPNSSGNADVCPSSDIGCEHPPSGQPEVPQEAGEKVIIKPKPSTNTRTAKHVKERIQTQLLEAVKRGEMPNYCMNCGAIETAVWRKVRLDTKDDKEVRPSADRQLKREEREGSEAEKDKEEREKAERNQEVLLCNACGLWFLSHKTMRPQNLWDLKQEPAAKSTNPKKRKKPLGVPTPPASSAMQPPSEPATEPILLQDEDATPRPAPTAAKRITSPSVMSSAVKDNNSEWNSGSNAGSRAARSSPAVGSADSPIDLDAEIDGAPSPRRLLFPTSRKADSTSPGKSSGKENRPPRENERPSSSAPTCPKTPTRARRGSFQLRTPLRSASRSITGSMVMSPCRSAKRGASRGPPATPERRLLKSQNRMSLSPTAGLLEKLLADDPGILGDFPNMNFDFNDDLLNTDLTVPSSPPAGFSFFDDTDAVMSEGMTDAAWSDFLPSTPGRFNVDDIFDDPTLDKEHSSGTGALHVDLSAFIDDNSTRNKSSDTEGSSPVSPVRTPKKIMTEAEKAAEAAELAAEIAELAAEAEEAARAAQMGKA